MRKLAFALVLVMTLGSAACGGDGEEPAEETGATGAAETTGPTAATGTTGEPTGAECVDLTGTETFTIVMGDDFFEPACFTASAAQGITIVNEGVSIHNFQMVGTMVDVDVAAGETFNGEPITGVVEPGDYELICEYHETLGMVGEVTVVA